MLKPETVLVLGAGASMPYGFPSGRKLVSMISTSADMRKDLVAIFADDELELFQEQVRLAAPPSIDTFLEHQPDLNRIGKAAIAWALIQFEKQETLFPGDGSPSWYEFILNKMECNPNNVCKLLTFITFNYDRSLDHFLWTALANRFSERFAEEQMKYVPIIHVHGQLGNLINSRYRPCGKGERRYKPDTDVDSIEAAAAGIKIISEAREEHIIERAAEAMRGAQRVYFLGFGYHKENIAAIKAPLRGDPHYTDARIIGGTCYGMTERERFVLSHAFGIREERLGGVKQEIEDFLRNDGHFTSV